MTLLKKLFIPDEWCCAVSVINENKYFLIKNTFRYWNADPFLVENNGKTYLFCESMDLFRGYGVIRCATVETNRKVVKWLKVIDDNIHFSYPCIFLYKNSFYMIPETSGRKSVELWKSTQFPEKWEFIRIIIDKIDAVDTTVFTTEEDELYLLCYIRLFNDTERELMVYRYDLDIDLLTKLDVNIDDALKEKRPGGKFFFKDGILFRPSQKGIPSYGCGLFFNQVFFTKEEYREKQIKELSIMDFNIYSSKKISGLHTYNQTKQYATIDLKRSKLSLFNPLRIIVRNFYSSFRYTKQFAGKSIFILAGYSSIYGGNFIASLRVLATSLHTIGYNVVFVFPDNAKERDWIQRLKNEGNYVMFLSTSKVKAFKKLLKLTKTYNCKILYSHFSVFDLISSFVARINHISLFIHNHSDFSCAHRFGFFKKIRVISRQLIIGKKVPYACVSKSLKEKYQIKNPIVYIPNALTMDRDCPIVEKTRDEAKRILGVNVQTKLVIIFAWSPKVKGLDIAIEAVKKLRYREPSVELGIVYKYNNKESAVMYISDKTSSNGTEDWIHYFAPREDVFLFHSAADIMLSASRSEGFSYSILEALAMKRKCVISDIAGTKWAEKYSSVFVFNSEDINDCMAMLSKALYQEFPNSILQDISEEIKETYNISSWVQNEIEFLETKL